MTHWVQAVHFFTSNISNAKGEFIHMKKVSYEYTSLAGVSMDENEDATRFQEIECNMFSIPECVRIDGREDKQIALC